MKTGNGKRNLLVAAALIGLAATMPINVSNAEGTLSVGGYTVTKNGINKGGGNVPALLGNFYDGVKQIYNHGLHGDEYINHKNYDFESAISMPMTYRMGTCLEMHDDQCTSYGWSENEYNTEYYLGSTDYEGNLVASINNGANFVMFNNGTPGKDDQLIRGYEAKPFAKFRGQNVIGFNSDSYDLNVHLTNENLTDGGGLEIYTDVPKRHYAFDHQSEYYGGDGGSYDISSGPLDLTLTGDIIENTGGTGVKMYLSYPDENIATELKVNDLNVKYNTTTHSNQEQGSHLYAYAAGIYAESQNENNILTMKNVHVDNNKTTFAQNAQYNQGNIYGVGMSNSAVTTVDSASTFNNNEVVAYDGNNAHVFGTALYSGSVGGWGTTADITITGPGKNAASGNFVGNKVTINGAGDVSGGAIANRGIMELTNSVIANTVINITNGGTVKGGGINTDNGDLNLVSDTISNNTIAITGTNFSGSVYDDSDAYVYGGGLFSNGSAFDAYNVALNRNKSQINGKFYYVQNHGGGAYFDNGINSQINIETINVDYNEMSYGTTAGEHQAGGVTFEGGGLYIDGEGGKFTLANSSVSHNSMQLGVGGKNPINPKVYYADMMGGGIFSTRSSLTLNDVDILGNTISSNAETIINCDGSDLMIVGGGGIYASDWTYGDTSLTANHLNVNDNTVYHLHYSNDTVYNYDNKRYFDVGGGGMDVSLKNINLTDFSVKDNKVSFDMDVKHPEAHTDRIAMYGGGMRLSTHGGTTLTDGQITGNELNFTSVRANKGGIRTWGDKYIYLAGGGLHQQGKGLDRQGGGPLTIGTTDPAASPFIVANNSIKAVNHSTVKENYEVIGGGISIDASGGKIKPTITNTEIKDNAISIEIDNLANDDWGYLYAKGGGIAMYMDYDGGEGSEVDNAVITNSKITGNIAKIIANNEQSATVQGGGLYWDSEGYLQVHNDTTGDNEDVPNSLTLNNVNINNNSVVSKSVTSANGSGGGLYLTSKYAYDKTIDITGGLAQDGSKITTIDGNTVNAENLAQRGSVSAHGGGLYYGTSLSDYNKDADRHLKIENLKSISGNKAIANAMHLQSYAQAHGGGLYIDNVKDDNEATKVIIKNVGEISNNEAIANAESSPVHRSEDYEYEGQKYHEEWWDNYSEAKGGGLYADRSVVDIINTSFKNNVAKATYKPSMTVHDSDFSYGGAIYAKDSVINIIADSEYKNIYFNGNEASQGSDIYLENSTLNLRPGDGLVAPTHGNKIIFTGQIAGDANSVINQGSAEKRNLHGTVILGGDGSQFAGKYKLYDGTMAFGFASEEPIRYTFKDLWLDGGTISLWDNDIAGDVVVIDKLTGMYSSSDPTDLYVDFNARTGEMDKLTVNSVDTLLEISPKINIKAINITEDGGRTFGDYLDGAARNQVETLDSTHQIVALTETMKYVFTPDNNVHGRLWIITDTGMTLAEAIQTPDINSYSFTNGTYVTTEDLLDLAYNTGSDTRNFTIFGNGNDLNGNGFDGVFTQAGQTLNIQDVPNIKNFGGAAIYNMGAMDELAAGVVNVVASSFSGNADDVINSGTLNLQSGDISFEAGIKDHTWGWDNGTTNINGANVTLGDNAVIWQNALNINSGSLTARAENLEATITNAGTLNLTGTLDKAILGDGTTNINNNLIFTSYMDDDPDNFVYTQAEIAGTLNLNNGILDASGDNSINGFEIGTLAGNGNFSIDAMVGDWVGVDCLNIVNNSATPSTVTLNAINLLVEGQTVDTVPDFESAVFYGGNANLAIGQELAAAYNKTGTEQRTDEITKDVQWNDKFGTEQRTITRTLSAVQSTEGGNYDTLKLATVASEWTPVGTQGDTLNLINTSDAFDEKTFNFTTAADVYTSSAGAGTTVGTLNLNGVADGDSLSTINLNNNAGFTVGENTQLNISNVNLKGNTNLITNNGWVDFRNANKLNGNITGNGVTKVRDNAKLIVNNIAQKVVTVTDGGTLKAGNMTATETFSLHNGLLDAQDGTATTYTVGSFIGETGNMNLDVDLTGTTPVSDAINITTGGNTIALTINDIALNGDKKAFTVDVLKGETDGATILLANSVTAAFNDLNPDWVNRQSSDTLTQTATWDDTFSSKTWQDRVVKEIGVTGGTTINYTETYEKQNEVVTVGDTIALLNQADQFTGERKYITNDPAKTHTATADFGNTAAGKFTIKGATDGENTSTINLNGKNGFTVTNGSELTLDTVAVTGAKDSDGSFINNTSGIVNLNKVNTTLNTKEIISNDSTLNVTDSTLQTGVTGEGTTNVSGDSAIYRIGQKLVNIAQGAKLYTAKLVTTDGTNNEGTLEVGGTVNSDISGRGTTKFLFDTTSTGTISQNNVEVDDGMTVTHTGDITVNNTLTNNGTITLNSADTTLNLNGSNMTNAGIVDGAGTAVVNGKVQNNGTFASKVKVAASGALATLANKITGGVENDAQNGLTLTGGDLASNISGTGSTTVSGDVTNTGDKTIANAVTVASGSLSTDASKITAGVTNNAALTLTGGNLASDISGTGNTTVSGNVTNTSGKDIKSALTVAEAASLSTTATALGKAVTNSGTVTLTGGTLANNISGEGSTVINGNVENKANITSDVNISAGALNNNGTIVNAIIADGASLTSNTSNVTGAITNSGTYNITGGNITSAIAGNGTTAILGDTTISAAVNNLKVDEGGTLRVATATPNILAGSNSVILTNGGTLDISGDTATNIALGSNLTIGALDNGSIALDWGDTFSTDNVAGNINISSIDLTATTGATPSYQIATGANLANVLIADNVNLITNENSFNTVKYKPVASIYGPAGTIAGSNSNLATAVTDTEAGESVVYAMTTDESAAAPGVVTPSVLDAGKLVVQGNGNTITDAGIVVGDGTGAKADLTLKDTNVDIEGTALNMQTNSSVTIQAETEDVTIDGDIISLDPTNLVTFAGNRTVNFNGLFDPAQALVDGSTVIRGGNDDNIQWTVTNGTLRYLNDSYLNYNAANTMTLDGGTLDLRNGAATNINIGAFNVTNTSNVQLDVDLANQKMDNFDSSAAITVAPGATLNVSALNLISDAVNDNTQVLFTTNATSLFGNVAYTGSQGLTALSPIYKYNVVYDETDGTNGFFNFARYNSGGYSDYNPSVLAAPIAAQLGGYLTQLNSYDQAFMNMDTYMMMPSSERTAMKMRNKIASLENAQYDDTKSLYDYNAGWFRPYATFETVALHNGPNVRNNMYGSFFGGESSLKDLGHGWDGMWGAYIGYNGSHQSYDGVGIYQNGGTLGLTGMAYKDNFFVGGTVNVGAAGVDASTMYGNDEFAMLMTGAALKTGYNWELANGKFIIQPSLMASYSFVNTFNYRNAAGVAIDSDPLHAITIEPGVKFIGNLKNGWQPYAGVSFVYNIMDRTRFQANDVSLPNFSINPFVRYGIGVRKTWGDRLTGHFQTYFTNGGRNGVGLSAGFRWAIGKNGSGEIKGQTPELKPAKITLNNHK